MSTVDFVYQHKNPAAGSHIKACEPAEVKTVNQERLKENETWAGCLNSSAADQQAKVKAPAAQLLGEAVTLLSSH